jgi:hypothetical protein
MRNQTDPSWITGPENEMGTGIFLIPNVESEQIGAVRKVFVPDLTYVDCARRGILAVAFKWVPQRIASFQVLNQSSCRPERCVSSCTEPGCMCDQGVCQ